jgi:hypothetical protein
MDPIVPRWARRCRGWRSGIRDEGRAARRLFAEARTPATFELSGQWAPRGRSARRRSGRHPAMDVTDSRSRLMAAFGPCPRGGADGLAGQRDRRGTAACSLGSNIELEVPRSRQGFASDARTTGAAGCWTRRGGRCSARARSGRCSARARSGRCSAKTLPERCSAKTLPGRCSAKTLPGRCSARARQGDARCGPARRGARCSERTVKDGREPGAEGKDRRGLGERGDDSDLRVPAGSCPGAAR